MSTFSTHDKIQFTTSNSVVEEDDCLSAVQEGSGMAGLQTSIIDPQCAQAQIWQKIKQSTEHVEKLQDVTLEAKSL